MIVFDDGGGLSPISNLKIFQEKAQMTDLESGQLWLKIEEKKRISQERLVWITMMMVPCLRLGTAGEDEGELQHANKVTIMSNRQDH